MLTVTVDDELLDQLPALKVVSNMAVGVDNIDLKACRARSIQVGNTPGVLTDATADLAFALLLNVARGIGRRIEGCCGGALGPLETHRLAGRRSSGTSNLGIVGLGKIGQAMAQRARAFGMKILYCSPSRKSPSEELGATFLSKEELLSRSDFVSLHLPYTTHNHHFVDGPALEKMKKTAYLINTSRGATVNQEALLDCLEREGIAGAGLDVTVPEPLPPSHPLFRQKNCLISPHIGSATTKTRKAMTEIACANILAGIRGEKLPHRIA